MGDRLRNALCAAGDPDGMGFRGGQPVLSWLPAGFVRSAVVTVLRRPSSDLRRSRRRIALRLTAQSVTIARATSSLPTRRTTTTSATPISRTSSMSGFAARCGRPPDLLSTMLVPKAEELVANPYRHGGKDGAGDSSRMDSGGVRACPRDGVYRITRSLSTTRSSSPTTGDDGTARPAGRRCSRA